MKFTKDLSKDVIEIVKAFNNLKTTEEHRYASWEFCYGIAQCMHTRKDELNEIDYDYMALNLAFYLASWGMYRSSFLLQHSYKIHVKVVKRIFDEDRLWHGECSSSFFGIVKKEFNEDYGITVAYDITDTLFTKILLGMTGKVVAYDRYCKDSLSNLDISSNFFGARARSWDVVREKLLPVFTEIINEEGSIATYHPFEYKDEHYVMNKEQNLEYPIEKYLDMFLFNLGRLHEELSNAITEYLSIGGGDKAIGKVKDSLNVFFSNGVTLNNYFVTEYLHSMNADSNIISEILSK